MPASQDTSMIALDNKEIIKRLEAEGWTNTATRGSHRQFTKPECGKVPAPRKDLPNGALRSIHRQAGWPWPP